MDNARPFEESKADKQKRAHAINDALKEMYPDAHCELDHNNAFELLISTILAAQSTDVMINKIAKTLYARFPDAASLAQADQAEVEEIVHKSGFFRNKAKNIINASKMMVEQHDGEVPQTLEELTALPGVARKTANVVLGTWFGINVGFVVDTHVKRISRLLRLTEHEDVAKIEKDLMEVFPQEEWADVSHRIIFHGRRCCVAKKPDCPNCGINHLCPSADTT